MDAGESEAVSSVYFFYFLRTDVMSMTKIIMLLCDG